MAMCADGLAKLIEECGELQQVAAKKLAYFDTDEHPDGSNLALRMQEEMADVLAACEFVARQFSLDRSAIEARRVRKVELFESWHAQTENDQGFMTKKTCTICGENDAALVDSGKGICRNCHMDDSERSIPF